MLAFLHAAARGHDTHTWREPRTDGARPAVELPARNVADTSCTAVVCRSEPRIRRSSMQAHGVFFFRQERFRELRERKADRPPSPAGRRLFSALLTPSRSPAATGEMRSIACLSISEYGLGSGPFTSSRARLTSRPAPACSHWPSSALTNPSGQMIRLGLSA